MNRIVLFILLAFAFGDARAQTTKEIGEAIMQSFLKKDSGYLRYYMPAGVYTSRYKKSIAGLEKTVKARATWEEISKHMEVTPPASSKAELVQTMLDSAKAEMHREWLGGIALQSCHNFNDTTGATRVEKF